MKASARINYALGYSNIFKKVTPHRKDIVQTLSSLDNLMIWLEKTKTEIAQM
jgi:hypothetical protein